MINLRMWETILSLDSSTACLSAGCGVCVLIWWYLKSPANLPPGPTGLPYIGNMLDIVRTGRSGKFTKYIYNLHEQYGPVISIRAGAVRFIIIKDGEFVAELFNNEAFAARPIDTFPVLTRLAHGTPRGVAFNNGESHKEMRRFAQMSLRDFGVGKRSLDEIIDIEGTILCDFLEDTAKNGDGIVSDVKIKIQYAAANIIHHIVFGYRYDYDDPKWIALVRKLYDFFGINFLALPQNFLPFLRYIPLLHKLIAGDTEEIFFKINEDLEEYVRSQIDDHRTTYYEGEIRDFIDLYIKYETEDREHYTIESTFATILDLFRAGTDTTATALTWAILNLVNYPKIQQQLQAEVDEVLGDRMFVREDKDKLIRTRAFINEIHRHSTIATLSPPHTTIKSVTVRGYSFPANTVVQASLYSMHHDKEYWGDPETFRIDRWIDEKEQLLNHENHFMPFSTGKRVCPGRQLANTEVLIILVQILKRFTLGLVPGDTVISDEVREGLIRSPKCFRFTVAKRQ